MRKTKWIFDAECRLLLTANIVGDLANSCLRLYKTQASSPNAERMSDLMSAYLPATRPTMYFIGVTTGQSSIMTCLPGLGRIPWP